MALNPKAKAETIWIIRTEREQYFEIIAALSFVMCIESRGNVRGDKYAAAFMAEGGEQQRPWRQSCVITGNR